VEPTFPARAHVVENNGPPSLGIPKRITSALWASCSTSCLRYAIVGRCLSLKEIGDQLEHQHPEGTRIYAKVDLAGLREVADFDLRGVL
jgi:integrase/recombinase XerD